MLMGYTIDSNKAAFTIEDKIFPYKPNCSQTN